LATVKKSKVPAYGLFAVGQLSKFELYTFFFFSTRITFNLTKLPDIPPAPDINLSF